MAARPLRQAASAGIVVLDPLDMAVPLTDGLLGDRLVAVLKGLQLEQQAALLLFIDPQNIRAGAVYVVGP